MRTYRLIRAFTLNSSVRTGREGELKHWLPELVLSPPVHAGLSEINASLPVYDSNTSCSCHILGLLNANQLLHLGLTGRNTASVPQREEILAVWESAVPVHLYPTWCFPESFSGVAVIILPSGLAMATNPH